MLDPQARALLDLLMSSGAQPMHTLTPQVAREAYLKRLSLTQPEAPAVQVVRNHEIPSGGARIKIREYRPGGPGLAPLLPALVYLHGGGWTIGSPDSHDVVCRILCNSARCVVFSVDYRLAPEVPFPAAYDDGLAAFRWVGENWVGLGIDVRRLAIGGDSAGGNLAAAVCLGLLEQALQPSLQLLIYPAVDQRATAPSHLSNGQGYLLTSESVRWYRSNYLPDANDYLDWRASPLLARSHAGLPSALILTAGFDPLRDEGLQYADALSRAGVASEYVCFERQIHGFITMGRVLREASTALELCACALRRAFAAPD